MAVIPLHVVDAFASRPFSGNPAAIIPNAATLGESDMLSIAEELGMEVGFVLPPEARAADVRLRFFSGRREGTLSGHVLLAAFTSMADRGIFRPRPEGRLLLAETLAGVHEVTLTGEPGGAVHVSCEMPTPRFGEHVAADEVAAALEISPEDVRLGSVGPQRVSCGFDHVVVPVADRDVMRGRLLGRDRVKRLLDERGASGLALFCSETHDETADFHCRFLHPDDRQCEDIASGTCLAAIGAFAVHHGLVECGEDVRVVTEQGHALGRPTRAETRIRCLEGQIHRVRLCGEGVVVLRGSLQYEPGLKAHVAHA
jgi:PhzF family phenazine biosynthesis protein